MSNFEKTTIDFGGEKEESEEFFDNTLGLAEYLNLQKKEALGETNLYFAGRELGHKPTEDEAMSHYVFYGGADDFRKRNLRHRKDVPRKEKYKYYKVITS
jgi:hypothetical protein